MCEVSRAEDDLITALRELDTAKALVRTREGELRKAVVAPSDNGCLSRSVQTFEAKSREMNEATKRYLQAVGAFNAVAVRSRVKEVPNQRTLEGNAIG